MYLHSRKIPPQQATTQQNKRIQQTGVLTLYTTLGWVVCRWRKRAPSKLLLTNRETVTSQNQEDHKIIFQQYGGSLVRKGSTTFIHTL